jgi:hypothetical protein
MEAIETAIVAAIVVVCIVYSVWRLTSARFHLRLIDLIGKAWGNLRGAGGVKPDGWIARLRNHEMSKLGGSCGSCASNVKVKVHGPGAKVADRPPDGVSSRARPDGVNSSLGLTQRPDVPRR